MAPPKTRAPAAEKLKFSDKLVKGHSTDVLLKKLKARLTKLSWRITRTHDATFGLLGTPRGAR